KLFASLGDQVLEIRIDLCFGDLRLKPRFPGGIQLRPPGSSGFLRALRSDSRVRRGGRCELELHRSPFSALEAFGAPRAGLFFLGTQGLLALGEAFTLGGCISHAALEGALAFREALPCRLERSPALRGDLGLGAPMREVLCGRRGRGPSFREGRGKPLRVLSRFRFLERALALALPETVRAESLALGLQLAGFAVESLGLRPEPLPFGATLVAARGKVGERRSVFPLPLAKRRQLRL